MRNICLPIPLPLWLPTRKSWFMVTPRNAVIDQLLQGVAARPATNFAQSQNRSIRPAYGYSISSFFSLCSPRAPQLAERTYTLAKLSESGDFGSIARNQVNLSSLICISSHPLGSSVMNTVHCVVIDRLQRGRGDLIFNGNRLNGLDGTTILFVIWRLETPNHSPYFHRAPYPFHLNVAKIGSLVPAFRSLSSSTANLGTGLFGTAT
ncbi:hypothetical protein IQ07DRAFT_46818 [Pyrenochaeta sp. DS3sAY3a]|nr:hypothetical protein IQ07DRAFT_46818 [Pyrenochaeta sp. DS3sAY3a]